MKTKISFLIVLTFFALSALNGQTIVSVELLNSYTRTDLILSFPGIYDNGVDEYKVVYNTVGVDGSPTVASGAFYLPQGCDHFPMAAYLHGTVFDREDVPSRGFDLTGLRFAGYGYATIGPDYLGLGDSDITIHPYHHSESTATASLDLMRAARTFIVDSLGLAHNGEVFITGYSQGGHAAMATHKYIEENNLLTEFNVLGSAPLSGAYDLVGTQSALPPDSSYIAPTYYPYLLESMQYAYGDIYTNTSEVYQEPWATTINDYKNGTISIGAFGANLPNNLYHFLNPPYFDTFLADTIPPYTTPLRNALDLNSNHDWAPQRPVRMVYCTGDLQVNYQNALVAEANFIANGATEAEAYLAVEGGNHGVCFNPAISTTIDWFDSKRTPCQEIPVSTTDLDYSEAIAIHPNPTTGFVQLNLTELPSTKPIICRVLSMSGQVLSEQVLAGDMYPQLHLDYPPGVYMLTLDNEAVSVKRKVVVF